MALTITQIVTGADMAAGGNPFQPQVLTLQALTNAVTVTVGINAKATPPGEHLRLKVYASTSPVVLANAATGAKVLRNSVQAFHAILPKQAGAEVLMYTLPPILVSGGTLYVWCDAPAASATLDVWVCETTV